VLGMLVVGLNKFHNGHQYNQLDINNKLVVYKEMIHKYHHLNNSMIDKVIELLVVELGMLVAVLGMLVVELDMLVVELE